MAFPTVDNLCDACKEHHARTANHKNLEEFKAPNPYAAPLAAMKGAESFEDRWKAERLRALAEEYAKIDATPFPRMTEGCAPPDIYAEPLKALRAKETRR
jgi:hypothetical protein